MKARKGGHGEDTKKKGWEEIQTEDIQQARERRKKKIIHK